MVRKVPRGEKMNPLSHYAEDRRKMRGVISTTFTFNVNFYENVILKELKKKGIVKKNVVLLDSSQYNQTFNDGGINQVSSAGVDYYLEPISVNGQKVFHPKIYFFAGERRIYAFIGSANLTQKGFTDNGELWMSFLYEKNKEESDEKQLVVLQKIRDFLINLLESKFAKSVSAISQDVIFKEILDSCKWMDEIELEQVDPKTDFLHNLDNSILSQVFELVDGSIQKVVIIAPYFGETTQVLTQISSYGNHEIELYLQQDKSQISSKNLNTWLDENDLAKLNIFDNSRFIHGKFILIKTEDKSFCLIGSPNPSLSGMLKSSKNGGNIETGILRKEEDPDYFDYLIDNQIVDNIVSNDAGDFNPSPESLIEDAVTEAENFELDLLDASYNRKTSFTGGELRLTISNITYFDGKVMIKGKDESFKLALKNGEKEPVEKYDDTFKIKFNITSDEQQNILFNSSQIWVETNGLKSNRRWIAYKSPKSEEIVEEGVESGATANVPNKIPDFLFGEEELRIEFFETVGKIIKGISQINKKGKKGSGGGKGRSLPPDWGNISYSPPKDPEDLFDKLYNTWVDQMKPQSFPIHKTHSESLVQNFSKYIRAMNKTTAHLLIIDNNSPVDVEEHINFQKFPRWGFKEIYKGPDSIIGQFTSRLIKRKIKEEDSNVEKIYSSLKKYIFPKIVFSSLIIENEEDSDFLDFYDGLFVNGSSHCFSHNHPMPDHLSSEFLSFIRGEIQDMVDELLTYYENESKIYNYIRLHYTENKIKDEIFKIYIDMLLEEGPSGFRNFYQKLRFLLTNDKLKGNQRNLVSQLSAKIPNRMKVIDPEQRKSIVSMLHSIEKNWKDLPERDQKIVKFAFPQDD